MLLLELLQASPTYLFFALALLGLIVGSFLNVVILRLPIMMERQWKLECLEALHPDKVPENPITYNLITPGSNCMECGHNIRPWENIPVLSYLLLKGKCSHCKTTISIRYPLIELFSAVLAVMAGITFGASVTTVLVCLLAWTLLALTMIDLDTQLLPDSMTLPLLWLGLLANTQHVFAPLADAVFGAVAGYLSLWLVYWSFKLATGKEGMGYGDFKLLAALGAWLGWQMLPLIILLSSLVGTLVGLGLMIFKQHQREQPIPFGPYLAAAGFVALLWGNTLTESYLQIMGI
ncbi:methyltransferase [Endozoicomonas montiporae]|uniref:Prepilin leader peptidase/N-methyltransferase n=2 Tax=Endozoicomonas montiporae TaxID=1027273 RepID=A0A081N7L4_9GAMM|nr:A24 family peptidase [Endozoicomonas montiporae]AMO55722.1 leader peptidase (prepilin peptidase) / N-methyltransferase [Endozoicomonas montiporae CL-33]KEQ14437.1 methyltransferase [Endozoicomonas montiporae]